MSTAATPARRWPHGLAGVFGHLAIAAAIAGIVTYLAIMLIPTRQHLDVYHVLSGSMEPTHAVGTTLLVQDRIDRMGIEEGQVITFLVADGAPPVTHRVIDVFTDAAGQRWYTTQGDANEDPDPSPVNPANLLGIVHTDLDHVLTLPVVGEVPLGQWVTWTRTVTGMSVLFGPVLAWLIAGELRVLFAGIRLPGRRADTPGATRAGQDSADEETFPSRVWNSRTHQW